MEAALSLYEWTELLEESEELDIPAPPKTGQRVFVILADSITSMDEEYWYLLISDSAGNG
jgi:hypothetical protein